MTQLDTFPQSAIIPSLRRSDARHNQRRKGQRRNADLVYHRKSVLEAAQPGRRSESLCPGRPHCAFSFWETVHLLIDKSEGVYLRPIANDGERPSRPQGSEGSHTDEGHHSQILGYFPTPSVSAMPREQATSGKALPGHVRVAFALAMCENDGLAPYEGQQSTVLPNEGELCSSSYFHHRRERPQ